MKNETNQAEYNKQRQRYLNNEITHEEFYTWLANFIGADKSMLPVPLERIKQSYDKNLNDIPLSLWDGQHQTIRRLAYAKGLPWALSDTVCTLKTIALNSVKTGVAD